MLLSVAAHELKNPLSAIFGYSDVILDTSLGEGLTDEQREVVLNIRSTSARTINLIRNYEYLSSVEESDIVIPEKGTKLNEVLDDLINSLWRSYENRVEIVPDLCSEDPLVKANSFQLERVFSNLISNAIKFSPEGGKVKIASLVKGRFAQVSVFNSGSFIPHEERVSIFEKFARGAGLNNVHGSGLGLYIVKKTLSDLNARITIDSSQERGTTFTVSLPCA